MQTLQALRTLTLSLAALAAGAALAAEPVLIAKASAPAAKAMARVETPAASSYMALADAERRIMGYADFDAMFAEALATPTAAGPATLTSRAAIEAYAASRMGGLMP